jgi:hypothetical protein
MKWFTVVRSAMMLALNVNLWGATATLTILVPAAHSQQEVDPTWYDPWAAQTKVVVPPLQPRVPDHKPQRKVSSVTLNGHRREPQASRPASTEASRAKMKKVPLSHS